MDLHNNVKYVVAVEPWNPSATGIKTGIIVDRSGFDSVEFVIANGAIAAAGFELVPIVFAGAATDALTSVADGNLMGTESGATLAAGSSDNKTAKIGYTGTLRYVRLDLNVKGAATGYHSAVLALGGAMKGPQSSQQV